MERKIAMNKGEKTEGGDNEANQTKTEEMYYFEYGISEQTADLLVKHVYLNNSISYRSLSPIHTCTCREDSILKLVTRD